MGLDQWILRGSHDVTPSLDENGDFINATELMQFRKAYWLQNAVMEIGERKLNKPRKELNCVYIPLTREDLEDIFIRSKECVNDKEDRELRIMNEFDTGLFYSNHDVDWCLDDMRYFNRKMGGYLRNKKETEYWYVSWW